MSIGLACLSTFSTPHRGRSCPLQRDTAHRSSLHFYPSAPGTHVYLALATAKNPLSMPHISIQTFLSFDPHHLRLIFLSSHPPPSGSIVKILSSVSSPSTILFSFSVPGYTPLWLIVYVRLSRAKLRLSQEKDLFPSLVKKVPVQCLGCNKHPIHMCWSRAVLRCVHILMGAVVVPMEK